MKTVADETKKDDLPEVKEIVIFTPEEVHGVFSIEGGVQNLFEKLKAHVFPLVHDVSDQQGRDKIKSLAYSVSRSKTVVEAHGKELVSEIKEKAKEIDSQRKFWRDSCDDLRSKVRAPLDAWEAAEKEKIDEILEKIKAIGNFAEISFQSPVDQIESRIEKLKAKDILPEIFGEMLAEAKLTKYEAIEKLEAVLAQSKEFHAAEAEKIEKIKSEAVKKQKEESDAREKQLIIERDQAAEKERKKIEYENQQAQAKENARKQDVEHRRKINGELLGSICATGMLDEDQAKEFIKLIHKGEIKNLKIIY